MIVTFVHVWVKDEHIEDFKLASIANHKESIKEAGSLRFDILRDEKDPSKFVFYEAYESEAAIAEHKLTSHYNIWRETVGNWMKQPRQGIKHQVLAPLDKKLW